MSEARGGVAYIDTSALLKVVVREAESEAVDRERSNWLGLATSMVTPIELRRAVRRARSEGRESIASDEALDALLDVVVEIPLTARVREDAASLAPVELRTLDAIHLASALALGSDLGAIITYDKRMSAAATSLGLDVLAPDQ